MKLFHLLKTLAEPYCEDSTSDCDIQQVTSDSRLCNKESIFVAIKGQVFDGHDYLIQAADLGCPLAIVEKINPDLSHLVQIKVMSSRKSMADLNGQLYSKAIKKLKLIAVTGTNGKTTCVHLIRHFLAQSYEVGIMGTLEYRYKDLSVEASLTTPSPEILYATLNQWGLAGCQIVVMEASSHALEQYRLSGLKFDTVLFTNLTQDHLDYHKDMNQYFDSKARLVTLLKDEGDLIINQDELRWSKLNISDRNVQTYGFDTKSDWTIKHFEYENDAQTFDINNSQQAYSIRSPLLGKFNALNAIGALVAASTLKINIEDSMKALLDFDGVVGRLEEVPNEAGFRIFIDYAHTSDALYQVLTALKPFSTGKVLLLFGCGGSRDKSKRPRMAEVAETHASFCVLTSDNPRNEKPAAIIRDIKSGFSKDYDNFLIQTDRSKAIRTILLRANAGDIVLIAGKGHEEYQIVGEERMPFSDKDEIHKVLQGR
ncbi:MAG: UDP-N-acetylmuramoyl-L-alanyl-D-glutamate--2,6-diaminopimelate ligase [Candidatus Omnitrophota bacterium]|jgi:UDP-N-acetylmuramoyl-L-alanyl-D-glutamate--2,6-diaminopimelate ligase